MPNLNPATNGEPVATVSVYTIFATILANLLIGFGLPIDVDTKVLLIAFISSISPGFVILARRLVTPWFPDDEELHTPVPVIQ